MFRRRESPEDKFRREYQDRFGNRAFMSFDEAAEQWAEHGTDPLQAPVEQPVVELSAEDLAKRRELTGLVAEMLLEDSIG